MAKIDPTNGKYELGGSKDTDLEGIDADSYDVFTDEDKLRNARNAFPDYDWFASYTIKDKQGNDVRNLPAYTLKFDRPDKGTLYYYLDGDVVPVSYEDDAEAKGNKQRARATLTIGDPPVGIGGG
jgi:hypothetical protein